MAEHDPLGIVGTTIAEKYDVEKVVGEGGFGIVYRAQHKIWNQPVAIKCFKALMDVAPDVRESLLKDFIQEGALLSQLSGRSASIVQARDVGTFTTKAGHWVPYMVLEWLEGRTLESILEAQHAQGSAAWSVERAMQVLEPVAAALEVVHRKGIAHRDIKPANIFVVGELDSDEMYVKVLDFGIAKVVQSAAEQGSFTKTGGAVTSFTPGYGAPEQFSRAQGATGPWTDVYALALLFTELLVGRPPLEGDDFIQLGMATADPGRRPTPKALGAAIPDELEQVLAKALAVRPNDRYPTAGELWNAVRKAMDLSAMPMPRATISGPAPVGADSASFRPATAEDVGAARTIAVGAAGVVTQPGPMTTAGPSGRSKSGAILGAVVGVAALGAIAFFALGGERGSSQGAGSPTTATPAESASAVAPAAAPKRCPDEMASIEGGKFFMGSDDKDADDDEKPAHQVTLTPYCIDRREVTVALYKSCSDVGECKRAPFEVSWKDITPKETKLLSPACNGDDPEKAQHPINCVDWEMAAAFCKWQGKRLPTEAEWEFAARGPDGRRYPWGDEAPDKTRMNACGKECSTWDAKNGGVLGLGGRRMYDDDDGYALTAPVGSFPAGRSRYGLLDVVGNVWEWTADWEAGYGKEPQTDPTGPKQGEKRVIRGGAFNGIMASWVRPSQRYAVLPEMHSHAIGFRCAKTL